LVSGGRPAYRPRGDYRVFRRIATRWQDNDVYGHVNNAVYYGWFDTAVNTHLIEAGVLDIVAGQVIGLVVETGCRYARAVAFPQVVEVGLRAAHVGRSSVRYEIGLFTDGSSAAAAEGFFVHVYVDRADRRPVELAADWRVVLQAIAD
jgi:acyl-CoA thioester hydrolase